MKKYLVAALAASAVLGLSACGSAAAQPPQTTYQNDNGDVYVQRVPVEGRTVTCLEWAGGGLSCDWISK